MHLSVMSQMGDLKAPSAGHALWNYFSARHGLASTPEPERRLCVTKVAVPSRMTNCVAEVWTHDAVGLGRERPLRISGYTRTCPGL